MLYFVGGIIKWREVSSRSEPITVLNFLYKETRKKKHQSLQKVPVISIELVEKMIEHDIENA